MSKEEFIALIGQDVVVDYNFCGELQQWSMKNFSIKDGVIRHNRLLLIVDVFIKGAHNPHKEKRHMGNRSERNRQYESKRKPVKPECNR